MSTTLFHWREIGRIPESPGVYAWYYSPEITEFDLHNAIEAVTNEVKNGNRTAAEQLIRQLLDKFVFSSLQEDPYQVTLRGPLKPRYTGMVQHSPSISPELIARIIDVPARLRTIKDVLDNSAPLFASPIYIGMSEDLRSRVGRHKALIEQYNSVEPGSCGVHLDSSSSFNDSQKDHSFARAVHTRGIPPTRLSVAIYLIETRSYDYVDIENILNRIHYPLLGRN